MIVVSTILQSVRPVLELIDGKRSWTWHEAARGCLADQKDSCVESEKWGNLGLVNWVCAVADSYKLFNSAEKLFFFSSRPRLVTSLKCAAICVAVWNLGRCIQKKWWGKDVHYRRPKDEEGAWQIMIFMTRINYFYTWYRIVSEVEKHPMQIVGYVASRTLFFTSQSATWEEMILQTSKTPTPYQSFRRQFFKTMQCNTLEKVASEASRVFIFYQSLFAPGGIFRLGDGLGFNITATKICDVIDVIFCSAEGKN